MSDIIQGNYKKIVQNISTSLIPIKGISKKMQTILGEKQIFGIPSLLTHCATQTQRDSLAKELNISVKLVNAWVKQADLWRVNEMTTDLAYLLVQAGIRSVNDLARVDVEKAMPILTSLADAQPDFYMVSKEALGRVVLSAKDTYSTSVETAKFLKLLSEHLKAGDIREYRANSRFFQGLIAKARNRNVEKDYGFADPEPTYLFVDGVEDEIEDTNSKIEAQWKDLFELDCVLPLPRVISGKIKIKSAIGNDKAVAYEGAKVEIDGFVSPSSDKSEATKNPYGITDANGRFFVTMPDRYCFKESVKIIVSDPVSQRKQEFVKSAAEIIASYEEREMVGALQDILADRIAIRRVVATWKSDEESLKGEISSYCKGLKEKIQELVGDGSSTKSKLNKLVEKFQLVEKIKKLSLVENLEDLDKNNEDGLPCAYDTLSKSINENDAVFDKVYQTIVKEILLKSSLEAKIEGDDRTAYDDGFVVCKEIMNGEDPAANKCLPSVRLMGDEENPIMLPTDTAPSRVYSYSMLQRLIEPKLKRNVEGAYTDCERVGINKPLDVGAFKSSIYSNPTQYPQMGTLGLGYQLNMHQAWIPDGFALGDLLYSTILAPGEEQRLIVRETQQTYEITDSAEGTDEVGESYSSSQVDDSTAVYNYAMSQEMNANSKMTSSSHTGGFGASLLGKFSKLCFGLSGSYSGAKTTASSSAHQDNSQNEASSAAQHFQQSIKSASNRYSQAKRVSVSAASSEVSESVATKIIANHNHSHAMTIQYWEVMRRYKLETAIDSVDLALFVPLQMMKFLDDDQTFVLSEKDVLGFDKSKFEARYKHILENANALSSAIPNKYRGGFNSIRKFAAYPSWEIEKSSTGSRYLTLRLTGNFIKYDKITATLKMRNGKGSVSGVVSIYDSTDYSNIGTALSLREQIASLRDRTGTLMTCTFSLPVSVLDEDISGIQITHSFADAYGYVNTEAIEKACEKLAEKVYAFAEDDISSGKDLKGIAHYKEAMVLAESLATTSLSAAEVRKIGAVRIASATLSENAGTNSKPISTFISSSEVTPSCMISVCFDVKTLSRIELQKMEEALHHICNDALYYSQAVWGDLSSDELAMMLDKYTIDMDYSRLRSTSTNQDDAGAKGNGESEPVMIPLLNCINVRKVLGFYGNCILFPFTFPQELSEKLGRTAAEIQDQLYRYHTNAFRAPSTVISMPTSGMIGEAVLGQSNVSELIDLTRFWNWQDSPIDKMETGEASLSGTDYLSGKTTKDISSLGLESATATTGVTVPDLISALVSKATPTFNNLTGLDQLQQLAAATTTSASTGRDNYSNNATSMATKAAELQAQQEQTEANNAKEQKVASINAFKETMIAALGGSKSSSTAAKSDANASKDDKEKAADAKNAATSAASAKSPAYSAEDIKSIGDTLANSLNLKGILGGNGL